MYWVKLVRCGSTGLARVNFATNNKAINGPARCLPLAFGPRCLAHFHRVTSGRRRRKEEAELLLRRPLKVASGRSRASSGGARRRAAARARGSTPAPLVEAPPRAAAARARRYGPLRRAELPRWPSRGTTGGSAPPGGARPPRVRLLLLAQPGFYQDRLTKRIEGFRGHGLFISYSEFQISLSLA